MTTYRVKGKNVTELHIDESAKEDFKEIRGWTEEEFNKYTEKVKE